MVTRLANIRRYSLQRERNYKVPLETVARNCVRLTRLVKRRESQSQVALKRTKCRVDVSYSTFITGTCNCFAGVRLLLSRCKGSQK